MMISLESLAGTAGADHLVAACVLRTPRFAKAK